MSPSVLAGSSICQNVYYCICANLFQVRMISVKKKKHFVPGVCKTCKQSDNLVEFGGDVFDHDKNLMLIKAARLGHVECVNACLAAGADVNRNLLLGSEFFDITPLLEAVRAGRVECAEILINAGADVNFRSIPDSILSSALSKCNDKHFDFASIRDHEKCVEILLQAGAKITRNEIENIRNKRCVELMVKAGADPNVLLVKTTWQHEIGEFLITAGADVNFIDEDAEYGHRSTALFPALHKNEFRSLDLLIKSGADVNIRDVEGNTALHLSTLYNRDTPEKHLNRIRCTEILLRAEIRINVANNIDVDNDEWHMFHKSRKLKGGLNALMWCKQHEELHKSHRKYSNDRINSFKKAVRKRDLLLLAAGEKPEVKTEVEPEVELNLKHLCRKAIREHLLDLDLHGNLFQRIPKLGLPSIINDYLLYNQTLDDDSQDDSNDDSNGKRQDDIDCVEKKN